ncbi:glycoside hydrolase family 3 N-terminal domain-containing protein [Streptomyces sp. NPDC048362]|uniref:glycoside hydrolase family 3 N-terminal domain-containing protein n=1 Tax=Streptomyces sp. NPDC048362 TaxID=3365539 RepID=UPI0037173C92
MGVRLNEARESRGKSVTRTARTALCATGVLLAAMLPLPVAAHAADASGRTAWSSSTYVSTDAVVYPIRAGGTAKVKFILSTSNTQPSTTSVTVRYVTQAGTATPNKDYLPLSGLLTFPVGSASGTAKTVDVPTIRERAAEPAETIPLKLTVHGAVPPATSPTVVLNAHGLPYLNARLPVRERVADLLARMSLQEKAGQMTQAERGSIINPGDIASYALGSVFAGGGSAPTPNTPKGWARMVDGLQVRTRATRFQIPVIFGDDAIHGHGHLSGATIMPHNIGLGATRDPQLVQRTGEVTAAELRATGSPWVLGPCLCVSRDERWGRSYESFGEDPKLVQSMETIIQGLQGRSDGRDLSHPDKVLATAKHFVGDGGTAFGSSANGTYTIDQGVTTVTRRELHDIHLAPFETAVKRGVGAIMPSYSSLRIVGDGKGATKMHLRGDLINGTLKTSMGFKGFVVSDWEALEQLSGDYASRVRSVVNAGVDMMMTPYSYRTFAARLVSTVKAGQISKKRIDEAVSRILTQKFRLGLFEHPYADTSKASAIGSPAHRSIARQAAAESQVLLKNADGMLPLKRSQRVYVAGSNAADIGNQSGGWTIAWQGSSGNIIPGTTILQGMREVGAKVTYSQKASASTDGYDVGVVVVGETPYAEGVGDVGNNGHSLQLSAADKAAVDRVCAAMKCAVVIVSGRPQLIGDRLKKIDALVAAWLPGSEGAGVADVLYGKRPFTGRLPVTWPRSTSQLPINVGDSSYSPQFPYGWGLTTLAAPPRASLGTLKELRAQAAVAERSGTNSSGRALVARAQLIVERKVGERMTEAVAKPFAEAAHQLEARQYSRAVDKLIEAYEAI